MHAVNIFSIRLPKMIALLIVGPKKNDSNVLRETDGERFFEHNTEVIFSNNSHDHASVFFRLRTIIFATCYT